jgi:hypothetical protein
MRRFPQGREFLLAADLLFLQLKRPVGRRYGAMMHSLFTEIPG